MPELPEQLKQALRDSFYLRLTITRKSGLPRVIELTYVWDGRDRVVLSGFPGKRDWVASMAAHPQVTVHSVESSPHFDIEATARVIRNRKERLPHLIAYIEHWTTRPGYRRPLVNFVVRMVKLNRSLKLPMWGPFWLLRRQIFDPMPCVEVTLTGTPKARSGGPPQLSEQREGRP